MIGALRITDKMYWIDLPICDKFLTNEIGIKYIGNMLKDIDIRLYLAYLKMLKEKSIGLNVISIQNTKAN